MTTHTRSDAERPDGRPRGTWRTRLLAEPGRRRRVTAAVAVLAAISVAGGTLAWGLGQPPGRAVAAASSSPSSAPSSAPTAEAVASVPPSDRRQVARLEASDDSGGVVPVDAAFRLTSLDGRPASDLAARVVVEPVVHLDIAQDTDPGSVRLVPSERLVPGAVYRFALKGDNGELVDSWAFQARQGVRIVSTLPEHEATDVPVDSGIEITFDQDGVTGAEDHVSIDPPTDGRFEQHGRVLAFVPKRLVPATAYTVTVSKGITVAATGEASIQDVTFRFETAGKQPNGSWLEPQDDLVESATSARPTIAFWLMQESETDRAPTRVGVKVYRLPTREAAIDAYRTGRTWRWLHSSSSGLSDTAGLTRVLSADLPLQPYGGGGWVALPKPLRAGWYLVQATGGRRPIQTVLQVTDLSAYLAVSNTKTVVWANDLASGRPLRGAKVSGEGLDLGKTGSDGLLLADTPPHFLPPSQRDCRVDCEPVLIVAAPDGRSTILPTGNQNGVFGLDSLDSSGDTSPRFWSLFNTDRTLFRPTDRINVWGMLRDRDTGDVPESVVIRLVTRGEASGSVAPPVATIELHPSESGVFAGSLATVNLPIGDYALDALAGDTIVGSTSVRVGQILKPAYRLDIETGRRVYIAGDRIRVTVRAAFYDGSPVPGVPLRVFADSLDTNVTTDAAGVGVLRTTARLSEYNEGDPDYKQFDTVPARPEEGEIDGASRTLIVFPSTRVIDGTSTIDAGRVRVTGSVNQVDRERLEREIDGGAGIYDVDPRGDAVSRARVTVHFVEQVPVRSDAHQEYDFVQKKVVTVYDYRTEDRDAGSKTVRTDAKGRFSASIAAGKGDHDYRVILSVGDPDGHVARRTIYATRAVWDGTDQASATLLPTDPADGFEHEYSVGEPIDLTFRAAPSDRRDGSFLFIEAQRGVRSAVVQSSASYRAPFEAADAPDVDIYGVRFDGSGYEVVGYSASFRIADRALDVAVTTTSRNVRPGDDVTVDIVVRNAAGKPVAGSVVIRAVDEKLYTIGAAEDIDALRSLYRRLSSGIRTTYWTHRPPQDETGGGDTGGGGDDRADFQDSLVFTTIETGADGRGSASFKLSDDLTSWRVSATALTTDLRAGSGTLHLPIGLPFFVDATIAPEYLTSDQPTILVRTFGTALHAGVPVSITVEAPSLGLKSGPLPGRAFESIAIPLPALRPGSHQITIRARSGSGSSALSDGVTRTFVVVDSRFTRPASALVDVTTATHLRGGSGLTTVRVADASASRNLRLLADLAAGGDARLDRSLAAAVATSLLVDRFDVASTSIQHGDFSAERYQTPDGGLALLPYASSDLELSTMAALAGRGDVDGARLGAYLRAIVDAPKETRERRIIALTGLAGLGSPVLPEVRTAAADPTLTVRERLFVGIGASRLGDATTARGVIESLVAAYGEQTDDRMRIRVGDSADDAVSATALMAVLAASVGDERAPAFWASVEANQPGEEVLALHAVAYVAATLDWLKIEPARFAWTLGGTRTTVDLAPGEVTSFLLTADQLEDFTIERLDGAVGVATSWREAAKPSEFAQDPDVSVERQITPAARIGASDLVVVRLSVTFSPRAANQCHQVTDHVPSGLVPVGDLAAWIDPNSDQPRPEFVSPYSQESQIVRWCAEPTKLRRSVELRYYARVITPGRYTWEPSIADSATDAGHATLTKGATIEVES